MRGLKSDYDNWANQGATGWSWSDVFPFFLKSEDNREIGRVNSQYHSTGGPLPVQRVSELKMCKKTLKGFIFNIFLYFSSQISQK